MIGQLLSHFLWITGQFQLGFHADYDLTRLRADELHVNLVLQQAFEQTQGIGSAGCSGHCQGYCFGFHAPEEMAFSASTSLSVA